MADALATAAYWAFAILVLYVIWRFVKGFFGGGRRDYGPGRCSLCGSREHSTYYHAGR